MRRGTTLLLIALVAVVTGALAAPAAVDAARTASIEVNPSAVQLGRGFRISAKGLCASTSDPQATFTATFTLELITAGASFTRVYSTGVSRTGKASYTVASTAGFIPGYYSATVSESGCAGATATTTFAVCGDGCGTYPPQPRGPSIVTTETPTVGEPLTVSASGLCQGSMRFVLRANVTLTSPVLRVGADGRATYTFTDTVGIAPGSYVVRAEQIGPCATSSPQITVVFTTPGEAVAPPTTSVAPTTTTSAAAAGGEATTSTSPSGALGDGPDRGGWDLDLGQTILGLVVGGLGIVAVLVLRHGSGRGPRVNPTH